MTKNIINSYVYMTELLIASGIFFFITAGNPSIASVLFATSFIVLLLLVGIIGRSYNKENRLILALVGVLVLNVVINALMSYNIILSVNYFKKLIMMISTCFIFYICSKLILQRNFYKYIHYLAIIISVYVLISYYLLGRLHEYEFGLLSMGFPNPNFAAMWLMHLSLYLFLAMVRFRRKWFKLLCAFGIAFYILLILQTGCRDCLIGLIAFAFLAIIGLIRKTRRFSEITIWGLVLSPIIISIFYICVFVTSDRLLDMFDFAASEGKSLTSREVIWVELFQSIRYHIIFGDYCGLSNGTGISQMHNTHLDVLGSYGLVPFILFVYLLYKCISEVNKRVITYEQYLSLCAFFSIVLIGSFEAAIVSGCAGLSFFAGGFLLLANGEQDYDYEEGASFK